MKKAYEVLILFTFCSVLITSINTLYALPDSNYYVPNINAGDSTPPVIIFNLSNMSTDGLLIIQVYDAETSLAEVNVYRNGDEINSTEPWLNVTWSTIVYDSSNTPLSVKDEGIENSFDDLTPAGENTYTGDILVDDVFLTGEHNDITVIADNTDGSRSTSTTSFCNTVDCWGRGGGSLTTDTPANIQEAQPNIPIMIFNMTGYYCCGYIEPRIEPNGNSITNFTVSYNETENMLSMTVLTENGYFYKSAIMLDYTVDLNLFGCEDCNCPIETPTGEPSFIFLTLIPAVVILAIILKFKKSKRKT
jgi:hypothetical protein